MKTVLLTVIVAIFLLNHPANAGWLKKGMNMLNQITTNNNYSTTSNNLSRQKIAEGLKEALKVGVDNVVKRLGRINGFYRDKHVHIPLPEKIEKIKNILNRLGMGKQLNELELKMNRAAEIATPKAKKLFLEAIKKLTIKDVYKIYKGPDDAATQYFKRTMGLKLKEEMRPVVRASLNKVKAVQTYNSILRAYNSLPFVKHLNLNLTDYVLNKTEDGIFYYLAKEEKAIRENPVKRTTQLLKEVFGRNEK